jgi:hypothetical protein
MLLIRDHFQGEMRRMASCSQHTWRKTLLPM